jgi:hypothetical protein
MMDPGTILAISTAAGGLIGGFVIGRQGAFSGAASINQLLQSRIDVLETDKATQGQEIARLGSKVEALEGLVTQKARVDELHTKVDAIATRLDSVAVKVGA